jgi:hypothetical protein
MTGYAEENEMNNQEAQKIVDNEDYLPWSLVAEARKVLGIYEQTAEEIYAEMLAKKDREAQK